MRLTCTAGNASSGAFVDLFVEEVPEDSGWPTEIGMLRYMGRDGRVDMAQAEKVVVRRYRIDIKSVVNGEPQHASSIIVRYVLLLLMHDCAGAAA